MKLTHIALGTVLALGLVSPAFAAMSPADMTMMKAEADKAGKTDAERVAAWKAMKADRQTAWKAECKTNEALSLPANEIAVRGDIPSFCKVINSAN